MNSKKTPYVWSILSLLIFPALQNLIYFMRFHALPLNILLDSMVFAPIGIISALLVFYLLKQDDSAKVKKGIFVGFIISVPISLLVSILGGLIAPPFVAATLFGSLTMIIGILIGYAVSKNQRDNLLLLFFSIIWGIALFPSIFLAFFMDLSVKVTPILTLIRAALLTLPIEIIVCLIISWILYYKKRIKLSNIIILIPLINILLLSILNLLK